MLEIQNLIKKSLEKKISFNFENLQPFVIDSKLIDYKNITKTNNELILSVPFKLWSIESKEGLSSIHREFKDASADFLCVVVNELSPGEYKFLISHKNKSSGIIGVDMLCEKEGNEYYLILKALVNHILQKINAYKSGIFNHKIRQKYKQNREKKVYRCSEIIYISKKSDKKYFDAEGKIPINWNHSWRVRGHWRKLESIESTGIDRAGMRTVKGFTWINPFIKGEGKEIIKVRKILEIGANGSELHSLDLDGV